MSAASTSHEDSPGETMATTLSPTAVPLLNYRSTGVAPILHHRLRPPQSLRQERSRP